MLCFSGCHVNFAVTVGVALSGGMKLILVPFYLIAQLLGSLVGAGIASVSEYCENECVQTKHLQFSHNRMKNQALSRLNVHTYRKQCCRKQA